MLNSSLNQFMPIGKYRGARLSELQTTYLLWMLSQDAIRQQYPILAVSMLHVMHDRFQNIDRLIAEMTVSQPSPAYWKLKQLAQVSKRNKLAQMRVEMRAQPTAQEKNVHDPYELV